MIIGIGNDLVAVNRVAKACEKQGFLTRTFTSKEIEAFRNKPQSLAGNFAVKEAISKCFGTGFRGFELTDIEVLREDNGKPYVNLYNGAKHIYDTLKGTNIFVSISNTEEYAMAMAVIEKIEE
jgi:holo-[acyl-carrier protein] synthase